METASPPLDMALMREGASQAKAMLTALANEKALSHLSVVSATGCLL